MSPILDFKKDFDLSADAKICNLLKTKRYGPIWWLLVVECLSLNWNEYCVAWLNVFSGGIVQTNNHNDI